MAEKIIWRHKARIQFDAIIDYISNEWGENIAKSFVVRTYEILDTLSLFPELGTLQFPARHIRGLVISKHTTIYYRIEGEQVVLLSFFNHRQNPKKRSEI